MLALAIALVKMIYLQSYYCGHLLMRRLITFLVAILTLFFSGVFPGISPAMAQDKEGETRVVPPPPRIENNPGSGEGLHQAEQDLADPEYDNRSRSLADLGKHQEAIDDFANAISLNPKKAFAYIDRGRSYEKLGQHQKAIDDYTTGIALVPEYGQNYWYRAQDYEKLGEKDLAQRDRNKAKELGYMAEEQQ
jgi:tetratricopeptide (TPR) repeat protein